MHRSTFEVSKWIEERIPELSKGITPQPLTREEAHRIISGHLQAVIVTSVELGESNIAMILLSLHAAMELNREQGLGEAISEYIAKDTEARERKDRN